MATSEKIAKVDEEVNQRGQSLLVDFFVPFGNFFLNLIDKLFYLIDNRE